MNQKMKLSIIIPVYNTSAYLRKCLDSVVKALDRVKDQVEVLIINDGSTDESGVIINEYCKRYSDFMCGYEKENGGLSDVKNYGLERARGEYVIFLDSDDYVDEMMYYDMLEAANKENADVVICDIKLVYDNPDRNMVYPCATPNREGIFAQVIDMNMMPASWNKIVRKTLYDGLDFPVGMNNEDVPVTPIVLSRAKKIVVVSKPYYNYYQREGSIQNSVFDEKRFIILKTAQLCMNRLDEICDEKKETVKGSIYVHQVLSLAFYPIRKENFSNRYRMLKKYMEQVQSIFPDIWNNFEVREYATWGGVFHRIFRRCSLWLLKYRLYFVTAIFWSVCNTLYKMAGKEI